MLGCLVRHCATLNVVSCSGVGDAAATEPVNIYADALGLATLSRWRYAETGVYDVTDIDLVTVSSAYGSCMFGVCAIMAGIGRRLTLRFAKRPPPSLLLLAPVCAFFSCGAGVFMHNVLVFNRDECINKQRMRVLMQQDALD